MLCAQPPTLKDKSLKVLTPDELGCALSGQWTAAVIGGVSGAAVAFGLLVVLVVRYRRRFQVKSCFYYGMKRIEDTSLLLLP